MRTTFIPMTLAKYNPKKIITVQIVDKKTEEPLAGVSVNITSSALSAAQQFSSHHSTKDGMVEDFSLESGVL